jgi:drug/metabolite transporter (DMT)-like permease
MQPTFLMLLAPLLFKEKFTLKKGICALVSLLGMVLVSGVTEGTAMEGENIIGIFLGLGAAMLYTTVIILNKKNPVENAEGKTVIQLFSAAAVMIPYLLLTEKNGVLNLNWPAIVLVLVVCIVHTGIAYAMYFGSLQRLSAQTTAVLSYIDPVVAVLLAGPILQETMSAGEIIGAILILGAALVSEIRRKI